MRKPDDRVRLMHMRDAALAAKRIAAGRTRQHLDTNEEFRLALTKCLEMIGEAAVHVTDSTRQNLADIPWVKITGMRNRLIHGYYDIDADAVWLVLTDHLDPLLSAIERHLQP
jgi:uncharacterized protein with HEPN domain